MRWLLNLIVPASALKNVIPYSYPRTLDLCKCHRYGPIDFSVFCLFYSNCEHRFMVTHREAR